jgi:hypothetical protein
LFTESCLWVVVRLKKTLLSQVWVKGWKDNIETVVKVDYIADKWAADTVDNIVAETDLDSTLEDMSVLDSMVVSPVVRSWSRVGLSVKAVV